MDFTTVAEWSGELGLSPDTSLAGVPLAFVDVETTGCSPRYGDRVIELAILRVVAGEVVATEQRLINPQRGVGAHITALTGITQEMVAGQPTFAELLTPFRAALVGAVVIGHNVSFDTSFLRHEWSLAGGDLADALYHPPVLDTLRIARRRFGRGGNGLQRLAGRLSVRVDHAHRALADCHTTFRCLAAMLEPVGGWGISFGEMLDMHGKPGSLRPKAKSVLRRHPGPNRAATHVQPISGRYG